MAAPFIIYPVTLLFLLAIILVSNLKVVPHATEFVIERFGRYRETWSAGLHWKLPFADRVVKTVSLKEQLLEFNPQQVITSDNVNIQINTVMFFQITDSRLFSYAVDCPIQALENLVCAMLRDIFGTFELDTAISSGDVINMRMVRLLAETAVRWGIKVHRVEVKNIAPLFAAGMYNR